MTFHIPFLRIHVIFRVMAKEKVYLEKDVDLLVLDSSLFLALSFRIVLRRVSLMLPRREFPSKLFLVDLLLDDDLDLCLVLSNVLSLDFLM